VIADPETSLICEDGIEGEIWISGPNVAPGYWKKPEENLKTFHASTENGNRGPYLRSGDLGIWVDDQLFITGRIKDVIKIRGMNHYPQDLEFTAEKSHNHLRLGNCAAFAIETASGEAVAIVQEIKRQAKSDLSPDEIFQAIQSDIFKAHRLNIHTVCLIKSGTLPKTTSGKVMRQETKRLFNEKMLNLIAIKTIDGNSGFKKEVQIPTPLTESSSEQIASELLSVVNGIIADSYESNCATINAHTTLWQVGLDSISVVELRAHINEKYSVVFSDTEIFESVTIKDIANKIELGMMSNELVNVDPAKLENYLENLTDEQLDHFLATLN
jgi:acyl carrier protein